MKIIDWLNKIKWDKNLNKDDFSIVFFDRITKKKIELDFKNIKVEGSFMVIGIEEEEQSHIPIHRIKQIKKKGMVIWER